MPWWFSTARYLVDHGSGLPLDLIGASGRDDAHCRRRTVYAPPRRDGVPSPQQQDSDGTAARPRGILSFSRIQFVTGKVEVKWKVQGRISAYGLDLFLGFPR